nr:T9SS type A sorting domain-containing protein [Chitinophagaceae bacterium]
MLKPTTTIKLCTVLAAGLLALPLAAQWSTDPTVANNRVVTATGMQEKQFIIPDYDGGAIVVWEDTRNGQPDIYYDRLDLTGVPVWSPAGSYTGKKLCSSNKARTIDRVLADGSGDFFVAWTEVNGSFFDIGVQKIDIDGLQLWGADGVLVCNAANDQYDTDLALDGQGGVYASWLDLRSDPANADGWRTYAQRINSTGTPAWTANGLLLNSNVARPMGIVADNAGGAIVAMLDARNSGTNSSGEYSNLDVYAQRINAAGAVQWTTNGVVICNQTSNQTRETIRPGGAVVPDNVGGAYICWSDYRNDPNNGLSFPYRADYYAQRIGSNGTVQWAANGIQLCTGTNADLYNTMAVPDGTGGLLAAWYDLRNSPLGAIYVQRVNPAGTRLYANNGLAVVTGQSHIINYDLSEDGIGNAVIAYDTQNDQIASYRFLVASGQPFGSGTSPICTRPDASVNPAVAADPNGNVFIAWQDYRNNPAQTDLYAFRQPSSALLPINLLWTAAQRTGPQHVQVQWRTSPLDQAIQFGIERSTDGQVFGQIGQLRGQQRQQQFSYTDEQAAAQQPWYYRLSWRAETGELRYSRQWLVPASASAQTRLWPNPASSSTTLYWGGSAGAGPVQLRLTDVQGKIHLLQTWQPAGVGANLRINTAALPRGHYFL